MERTMSISIGSNYSVTAAMAQSKAKTENLEDKLNNKSASDEELMEACKSFEAYMLEQVFKGMEKTVLKDEEEDDPYLNQFGDILYEEYAKAATENEGIGLAKMLYESMKRTS